jgi:hypothetical protein
MLLMWDRGFHSYGMVRKTLERGADFLGRVTKNAVFKPLRTLSDGSYIANIYKSWYDRKNDRNGVRVRVVEYTIDDPSRAGHGEKHRLITSLFDPELAPADTLAVEYHQRWEIEMTIDEMDTHQRVRTGPLRSLKPEGVIQECYGLLIAHYLVRYFMYEAATTKGLDPDRLSFIDAVRIVRRKIDKFQIAAKRHHGALYRSMLDEIAECLLPRRDNRCNPRVVKKKVGKFKLKRDKHRHVDQPRRPIEEVVEVIRCA